MKRSAIAFVLLTACSVSPEGSMPIPPPVCVGADCNNPVDPGPPPDTRPTTDGGVVPQPDSGPAVDAGPPAPEPGDGVDFTHWPSQRQRSSATWGSGLTDVANHLPPSYGTYYDDADLITFAHETTHGINAHLRNNMNTTGKRANGFYVMKDRGVIVVEPNIRKSAVAQHVPAALRESRFSVYVTGQTAWDDTPLYVWDEWVAYTNGGEVGVDQVKAGKWTAGWRDGVMGQLEFTVYALAVGMAVEQADPQYLATYKQFREFLAWNTRRAMAIFHEGSKMNDFKWDKQDQYWDKMKNSADAKKVRQFARRLFGKPWAEKVLGFAAVDE